MIFDHVKNARLYYGLGPAFEAALRHLAGCDFSKEPVGDRELTDGVILKISEYSPKDPKDCKPEAHRRYADIQVVLSGVEAMGYANLSDCRESESYDPAADVAFYAGEMAAVFPVPAGRFVVFLPDDAHQPSRRWQGRNGPVKKAVYKIPL